MTLDFGSVTLLRFPRDDHAFEAFLERIAMEIGALVNVGPARLQERLRENYPNAVVHEQDPLGGFRATGSAWYVYRDGSPLGG
jgi:hypothetical protein